MNTPICDFVEKYAREGKLRLHMPGHKGSPYLGLEDRDIADRAGIGDGLAHSLTGAGDFDRDRRGVQHITGWRSGFRQGVGAERNCAECELAV